MDKEVKKELAEVKEAIITARLSLAASHKKLDDIVSDEEAAIDDLEDADADKNIMRAERGQELREATDDLDEALQSIEENVISKLEE